MCVRRCPTFPPGLGSIIGAGRLSFRVRDGSGRFPAAVTAVTLFSLVFECPQLCGGSVIGGGVCMPVCEAFVDMCVVARLLVVCKFSAG
jgi:hypothetical protein